MMIKFSWKRNLEANLIPESGDVRIQESLVPKNQLELFAMSRYNDIRLERGLKFIA